MHTVLKSGLVAAAVLAAGSLAHIARADDAPSAIAKGQDQLTIPAALEAQIRAMVRAHAPAGQADAEEARAMALIQAHLAEVAKDPAMAAQARQVMAAAAAGDHDAVEHIHHMLMEIAGGSH